MAPLLFLAALTENEASAVWYIGNPVLDFRVDRPADDYVDGSVTLAKVRVHHCAGGYTDYAVNDTIDPVVVNHLSIAAGNECSLTFYWDSNLDVNGAAFTVRYSQATTSVPLATDIDPVALTPYSVVSGSMSGGAPWLLTNIE